eukprot:627401-Prymnesium_polylepis.1
MIGRPVRAVCGGGGRPPGRYVAMLGSDNLIESIVLPHDTEARAQLMHEIGLSFRFSQILSPSAFLKPPPVVKIKDYL